MKETVMAIYASKSMQPRQQRKLAPVSTLSFRKIVTTIASYGSLIILTIIFLLPFYLIVRNGLATDQEITSPNWTFFPKTLHFENIQELFNDPEVPFLSGVSNSALISVLQTVGQILICALAGYGLARIPYRWSNQIFYAILITLMIPFSVIFVEVYLVVSYMGWLSTLQGLVVPGVFSGFTAFLFRQFFLSFPRELEEAGRVDGLGYWGVFWRIVVPNSYGIIAALSVIAFINSWNAFLWPQECIPTIDKGYDTECGNNAIRVRHDNTPENSPVPQSINSSSLLQ